MAPTPNSALLAAHLREDTADLLALLPAARRAAAGGPGGGEATLDGIARAAYRTLRTAENLAAHAALCTAPPHPQPVCVTALAAAYVSGAAGVCRSAVFVPEWPRAPLWAMGDARLFAAALGNLLANAVQYGGERPAISVRAARRGETLLLTVADNGPGCAPSAGDRGLGTALCPRLRRPPAGRQRAGARRVLFPVPAAVPARRRPQRARLYGRPLQSAVRAACACVRSAVVTVRPPECSVPAREAVSFLSARRTSCSAPSASSCASSSCSACPSASASVRTPWPDRLSFSPSSHSTAAKPTL